ncbi:hypothetical protein K466DRAFT_570590 [Polyporus arcularius HHB13444]|uniref:Uncharacterized protein n=1 Tax=Polyporus arcularius HHB13444 TaxID=1314778 RepID=A0A5C3NR37_9APHY|nr:hypothetical protein K466DRAFT_570590 [Polyporus arcularius HHB13444]
MHVGNLGHRAHQRNNRSPSALPQSCDTHSPSVLLPSRDLHSQSTLLPSCNLCSPSAFTPDSPAYVQHNNDNCPKVEFVRSYSDDHANNNFGLGLNDQEDKPGHGDLEHNTEDNMGVHGVDHGGMNGEDYRQGHALPQDEFNILLANMKQDINDMLVGVARTQSAMQSSLSGSLAASVALDAAKALLQALGLGGANKEEQAQLMVTLLKQAAKLRGPKKGTLPQIDLYYQYPVVTCVLAKTCGYP